MGRGITRTTDRKRDHLDRKKGLDHARGNITGERMPDSSLPEKSRRVLCEREKGSFTSWKGDSRRCRPSSPKKRGRETGATRQKGRRPEEKEEGALSSPRCCAAQKKRDSNSSLPHKRKLSSQRKMIVERRRENEKTRRKKESFNPCEGKHRTEKKKEVASSEGGGKEERGKSL